MQIHYIRGVQTTCVLLVAYPHCVPTIDAGTVKTLYIREALTVLVNNFGPSKLLFLPAVSDKYFWFLKCRCIITLYISWYFIILLHTIICYETSFISAMYPNFCGFYWSVASQNSYPYTNTLILVLHCLPCTNTQTNNTERNRQTTLSTLLSAHV